MSRIEKATSGDLEAVVQIDQEVIGHDGRREELKVAIDEGRCLITKEEGTAVGFLVYDQQFFDQSFISLVIVSPGERKKGYARVLMERFEQIAPTEKIFSSTNRSNRTMEKVFESLGYVKSGWVENLDEADPEIIYFKKR